MYLRVFLHFFNFVYNIYENNKIIDFKLFYEIIFKINIFNNFLILFFINESNSRDMKWILNLKIIWN